MSIGILDINYDEFLAKIDYHPERDYKPILAEGEFPAKDRVAMVAPAGGGKTTTMTGIFNRAISKVPESLKTSRKFKVRILPKSTNLRQDISNLCNGIFPMKTQVYLGVHSSPGMLIEQETDVGGEIPFTGRLFGRSNFRKDFTFLHKARQLSYTDLPGETISYAQWQYRLKTERMHPIEQKSVRDAIGNAIVDLREANELMFVCNCARAQGLGLPVEDETDPYVCKDPDVSLASSFTDITGHKEKQGDRVKEVYIILAAWDKLEPKAKELGFDLFDPNLIRRQETLTEFTASCFRQFFAELYSHGIPNNHIHYYPTFFQTVKNEEGVELKFEDAIEYLEPDGTVRVKTAKRPHIIKRDLQDPNSRSVFENVNKISYSEESYDQLLNDIMLNAPKVRG